MTLNAISFFRKQMMPSGIILKYGTARNRMLFGLLLGYFILFFMCLIVAAYLSSLKQWAAIPLAACFLGLLIDFLYSRKKEKGIFHRIDTGLNKANLKVMEPYKEMFKIEFTTIGEGVRKVQYHLFREFSQDQMTKQDYEDLLVGLRHRENSIRSTFLAIYAGILICTLTALRKIMDFFISPDLLKAQWTEVVHAKIQTPAMEQTLKAIVYIIGIKEFLFVLIAILLYKFLRNVMNYRLRPVRELQEFLENLIRSKKR